MGRKRRTGCTAEHRQGERCNLCENIRACKARLRAKGRRKKDIQSPERRERDTAAAQRRRDLQNARRYVWTYLKRGTIIPPSACEHCGDDTISFWHPNPKNKRDIAWLCRSCACSARRCEGEVQLTWSWPGHSLPLHLGRPPLSCAPFQERLENEWTRTPLNTSRWVAPAPQWERRPRIDREPPPPAGPSQEQLQASPASTVFDPQLQAEEQEAALAKFESVLAAVEAIWAKLNTSPA